MGSRRLAVRCRSLPLRSKSHGVSAVLKTCDLVNTGCLIECLSQCVLVGRSALMEGGYGDVECVAREGQMDGLETMHPLDPPPPDVLLALLARNKALEGEGVCDLAVVSSSN